MRIVAGWLAASMWSMAALAATTTLDGVTFTANGATTALPGVTFTSPGGTTPPPTTDLLPPDRDATANWKMAGMLSVGGIPTRNTVCATLSAKGNRQDDSGAINSAINACPVGQVVKLNAGTFTVSEGNTIRVNKGVTVRGAGAGTTILTRTGGATMNSYFPGSNPSPMVQLGGGEDASSGTLLTADAADGANSVRVADATGFKVGQFVLLNEASGAAWQPDPLWTQYQIWASPDYRVVWQKHKPQGPADDFGSNSYPSDSGSAGCWFAFCDRPTNEVKQVSAVSGNTISFDSPVMISYSTSKQAKLYYLTGMTQQAGLEGVTAEFGDATNFKFEGCAYCWILNSESRFYLNGGVGMNASFRIQLEGTYIHEAAWPVNGGAGYNIMIAWETSEALIQNNISVLANKVMVAQSAGAGSVVAYNYMDDGYINDQTWVEAGLNASHMVGPHHVLFEGNQGFNIESDTTHGNSIYMTFFRNYIPGFRKAFTSLGGSRRDDMAGCCGPLRAASPHAYSYWFSFFGNVLGTSGKMQGWSYEDNGGLNRFPEKTIWALGWMDISPQGTDPKVPPSTIREGNYDYVSNAVKWSAGAKTLPNSLYLAGKPAFFGTSTWPWVNPLGNPQVYTLPAKVRYDAGTPNMP